MQHLQSGDAKVTMARDGQDLPSFFDRKSRLAEAVFWENEAVGFYQSFRCKSFDLKGFL